jgi:hypothetical protein
VTEQSDCNRRVELSVAKMNDSIGGRGGLDIVRHQQYRSTRLCELAKVLQDFGCVLGIEVSGWLVSEQNLRLVQ